jgi:hypothetical protein
MPAEIHSRPRRKPSASTRMARGHGPEVARAKAACVPRGKTPPSTVSPQTRDSDAPRSRCSGADCQCKPRALPWKTPRGRFPQAPPAFPQASPPPSAFRLEIAGDFHIGRCIAHQHQIVDLEQLPPFRPSWSPRCRRGAAASKASPYPEYRLALFQSKEIRRTFHANESWFGITDVVAALTDSSNPSDDMKKLRQRDHSLLEAFQGRGQLVPPL